MPRNRRHTDSASGEQVLKPLLVILTLIIILVFSATILLVLYNPDLFKFRRPDWFNPLATAGMGCIVIAWLVMGIRLKPFSIRRTLLQYTGEISAREETEQALEESEQRFKQLVDNAPVGIITCDLTGQILDVNPKLVEVLGSPSASHTRELNMLKFPLMVKAGISANFKHCITTGEGGQYERDYTTKWGKRIYLRYNVTPLWDIHDNIMGAMAIMEDFSERKKNEEELQTLNRQIRKDAETHALLLEEVNHRVKNNLAGIIGMLYATRKFSGTIDGPEAYRADIGKIITRIEGIAGIHEILTEANWSSLPISELTNRILSDILQTLPPEKQVHSDVIMESDILIPPKHANNLGMVINELITNTVKHALGNQASVTITVLISVVQGEVRFLYHNDGPGFPEEVLNLESIHTGIYLINTIVKNGLGGSLELKNDNGALTCIRFKPE